MKRISAFSHLCILIAALTKTITAAHYSARKEKSTHFCHLLASHGGGKLPQFVLVVSHIEGNENLEWTTKSPMPVLVYRYGNRSGSSSVYETPLPRVWSSEEHIPTLSAFIQFILDHALCLPSWTLFLSSQGRDEITGRTLGSGGLSPLAPFLSCMLLDVRRIDNGFLSVTHFNDAEGLQLLEKPKKSKKEKREKKKKTPQRKNSFRGNTSQVSSPGINFT